MTSQTITRLPVEPLTEESFRPFGQVIGESGARLRVSRPRAGGEGERTWRIGDDVTVSVLDPTSCRLFRGRRK